MNSILLPSYLNVDSLSGESKERLVMIIAMIMASIRTITPRQIMDTINSDADPSPILIELLNTLQSSNEVLFGEWIVDEGMVDRVNDAEKKLFTYIAEQLSPE